MKKTPKTCDYDYWTVGEGFRWLEGEYTHVCMFVCSRACVDVCVHACYVIVCDSKKNVSTGRQCDLCVSLGCDRRVEASGEEADWPPAPLHDDKGREGQTLKVAVITANYLFSREVTVWVHVVFCYSLCTFCIFANFDSKWVNLTFP